MNTGHLNYHEYEYRKDPLIMSMNSKRKLIFNSTHMNTALFITCSGVQTEGGKNKKGKSLVLCRTVAISGAVLNLY